MSRQSKTDSTSVTRNFRQHGNDPASHRVYVFISGVSFSLLFPQSLSLNQNLWHLIGSLRSLFPPPLPHLVNSKPLVGHGKQRRREKRESLCFGVYCPAGLRRPPVWQGERWALTPSWGWKSPVNFTILEEKKARVPGCRRSRWGRARVGAGASRCVQVVVLLTFNQGLDPASASSAWSWHEPRQRLCPEKRSQGPAALTKRSWLKPKFSNIGSPSSPADLKYLWAPGLSGQKGPWWEEDVFRSLNRLGASWASLPQPRGVWVQSSCLANRLQILALITLLANTVLK